MRRFALLCGLLLVAAFSCANAADRGLALPTAEQAVPDVAAYDDFGRAMAEAFNERDAGFFSRSLDRNVIIARIVDDFPESNELRDVRRGMEQAIGQVGERIMQSMYAHSQAKFVRTRYRDGVHQVLLRIDHGEEGLSYLEFETRKTGNNQLKVVDWTDHALGQRYTESVRQALALILPLDRTVMERVLGINGLNNADVKIFIELARLQREQRFDEWLSTFPTMSAKTRDSRIMQLVYVTVASYSGNEAAYRDALESLAEKFGDDPRLALILIDQHVYSEDWAAAHAALDRLNEYTGGDAALDAMRANIFLLSGDIPNTGVWAQRAIDGDPDYEDPYWARLEYNVASGRFADAVRDLKILEDRFDYRFDAEQLAQTEGYARFSRSPEYQRWAKGN